MNITKPTRIRSCSHRRGIRPSVIDNELLVIEAVIYHYLCIRYSMSDGKINTEREVII